jgi:glycosyltransferase involved in cell wall biosynthesis
MSSLPEVEVLLATYNGARFLREQLDSIMAQDYGNIRVLARDDGSSDGTVEILDQYAKKFPGCFRVMPASAPTGTAKNDFLLLMKASTAEYICFADQDDVWLPDKVSRTKQAMDQLESRLGTKVPLLVFTDLRPLDRVAASYMGKSSGVEIPTVLYRQHEHNVLGTGRDLATSTEAKPTRPLLERMLRPRISEGQMILWNISQREARAFLQEYGTDLPTGKRALLRAFLRCQTSTNRLVRTATFIRYGFYYVGLRLNLVMMLHLWNMGADER